MDETKTPNQEGAALLSLIRKDADKALREVYRKYRSPFHAWVNRHFRLDEATINDVFQDVVIAFYQNVISKKLQRLDASPKTYLFTIGKYQILKQHRQKRKENTHLSHNFDNLNLVDWNLDLDRIEQKYSKEERVVAALEHMGGKCQKLLTLFYFQSLSHQEIVDRLGYNSVEVSRSMKRKCMSKLRKIMQEKFSKE